MIFLPEERDVSWQKNLVDYWLFFFDQTSLCQHYYCYCLEKQATDQPQEFKSNEAVFTLVSHVMLTCVIHKGKRLPLLKGQKHKGDTKIISNSSRNREYGERITTSTCSFKVYNFVMNH